MPKPLFTPTRREELNIERVYPQARLVSSQGSEDEYEIEDCRVTCRYWVEGGDFVSRQILGCGCAIESGQLHCEEKELAEKLIDDTKTVIGMVGPDFAVNRIASKLASRFSGILVDGDVAVLVSRGN